jgi:hypothetical protein
MHIKMIISSSFYRMLWPSGEGKSEYLFFLLPAQHDKKQLPVSLRISCIQRT